MIDLPLPEQILIFPELTSLCTLETALDMSTYALYLSYPGLSAAEAGTTDPDRLAAATVLRSIRSLKRDLDTYRRVLDEWLAPEQPSPR